MAISGHRRAARALERIRPSCCTPFAKRRRIITEAWPKGTPRCASFIAANHIDYAVETLLKDGPELEHLAKTYNGPGAVDDYSQKVLNAIADLQR
jgi:hypothetical protein